MVTERAVAMADVSIAHCRNDFPVLSTRMNGQPLAFLDNAASAQKPQVVIDTIGDVFKTRYANVHRGLYVLSQNLTQDYETVRSKIADFIKAPSDQHIVFTRNSTEAINLIAHSWGRTHLMAGDEVVISAMEHHANIVPWQILEQEIGIVLKVIPLKDNCSLDLDVFESLLSERTRLVGVVHVSNALGVVNDIETIIRTTKAFKSDIRVLIDGSQAAVHRSVDVMSMGCDFYVLTGHKLYGPTGVGILYGTMDVLESMTPYQG